MPKVNKHAQRAEVLKQIRRFRREDPVGFAEMALKLPAPKGEKGLQMWKQHARLYNTCSLSKLASELMKEEDDLAGAG